MKEEVYQERVYRFDNLKFVLIALVVIGHCIEPYVEQVDTFKSIFIFIYTFHMPAFFLLMGLFAKNTVKDAEKTKKKVGYFLALFFLLKGFKTFLTWLCFDNISFHLLWEDGLPWFMLVSAFFYGITYITKDWKSTTLVFVSILLGCLVGYDAEIQDYLCLSRTIVYYPFFVAGYLIEPKKMLEKTGNVFAKILGILGIIGSLGITFFQREALYEFRPLLTGKNPFEELALPQYGCIYRFVYYILVMAVILCLIAVIPDRRLPISSMGGRTLQVYFLHFVFVYPMRAFGYFDWLMDSFQGSMQIIGFLATGLLITLLLSTKIVEKPFNALTRIYKS